jgi:hypothetical protein
VTDHAVKGIHIRLYHFLSAEHALEDIAKRRIKISEIKQLNDPFELVCVYQKDQGLRQALRVYKMAINARYGVLCFSKHWHNPVLWSHYADKHRGICLGFDIDSQCVRPVTYVSQSHVSTFLCRRRTQTNFSTLNSLAGDTKRNGGLGSSLMSAMLRLDSTSTALTHVCVSARLLLAHCVTLPRKESTTA